jgi:hypothetical protein
MSATRRSSRKHPEVDPIERPRRLVRLAGRVLNRQDLAEGLSATAILVLDREGYLRGSATRGQYCCTGQPGVSSATWSLDGHVVQGFTRSAIFLDDHVERAHRDQTSSPARVAGPCPGTPEKGVPESRRWGLHGRAMHPRIRFERKVHAAQTARVVFFDVSLAAGWITNAASVRAARHREGWPHLCELATPSTSWRPGLSPLMASRSLESGVACPDAQRTAAWLTSHTAEV